MSEIIGEENTRRTQAMLNNLRISQVTVDDSINISRVSGDGNVNQQGQTNINVKVEAPQKEESRPYVTNSNDDFGKKHYYNPKTDQFI